MSAEDKCRVCDQPAPNYRLLCAACHSKWLRSAEHAKTRHLDLMSEMQAWDTWVQRAKEATNG